MDRIVFAALLSLFAKSLVKHCGANALYGLYTRWIETIHLVWQLKNNLNKVSKEPKQVLKYFCLCVCVRL